MYLLTAVVNNDELLDDLITGWLDIGITGATVMETTDSIQLISHNVPIFAGFRSLTSGGKQYNKTIFTAIDEKKTLDQAIAFLKTLCMETGKPHQGIYFVTLLEDFGHLGLEVDNEQRQRHMEKKIEGR